ncbi:MAG: TonB family protein [Beijerinckiaceae bacterium]
MASAVVLMLAAGFVAWLDGRAPDGPAALGLDDAVLLDLPPAPASSAPVSDAVDGPKQQASEAVASPAPPKEADPAPEPQRNQEDLNPDPVDRGEIAQPSPKPELTTPPVAATPAQEEMAPASSLAPVMAADLIDSEAAKLQAAQALTQWQKAMLNRLEAAKAGTRSGGLAGTVEIAFTIDRKGNLLSRRIARSSGSSRLDQAALGLLNRAAPFPVPPDGMTDAALSFTVPIVFVRK